MALELQSKVLRSMKASPLGTAPRTPGWSGVPNRKRVHALTGDGGSNDKVAANAWVME